MTIEYADKEIARTTSHLDLQFFEEVVENALRCTNLVVDGAKFSLGSSIGENYCSQIYRVKIAYRFKDNAESKTLSVIVKNMPPSAATEFLDDVQVFLKERIFYAEVLPRLKVLATDGSEFGARLYHSLKLPVNTLVFEDLTVKNFETASREHGLDELHCRYVMQKLAQFHATSMIVAQKEPELITCYTSGMLAKNALERDGGMITRYFTNNIEAVVDMVSRWAGYEGITKKLRNYAANLQQNLISSQAPMPGELKVLNHGDLWVNNILFKYDQQRNLKDLIFVDFQMSIWGSPGLDLNYFFYSSLQLDVLQQKRESLIKEYHEALSANLRQLNYAEVPSYNQLLEEVKRREPYGFFANFGVFPTICLDKALSGDNSLDNMEDVDFAKKKVGQMFASKRLQEIMRYTIKCFDEVGVFD